MSNRNQQPDRPASNSKLATFDTHVIPLNQRNSVTLSRPLAQGVSRLPPKLLRGRPHRRKTDQIEITTARDVRLALAHACHLGRRMNRHLTVCWEFVGVADGVAATGRLMKLICDGARRRGQRVSYVWVRENGVIVGDHVHVLFHLPEGLSRWYATRKPGWLKRCGATRRAGTSKTTSIWGADTTGTGVSTGSGLYLANLKQLERYVLKHCSPEVSKLLGIKKKGSSGIVGKRVSISQDLHRKARRVCEHCSPDDHETIGRLSTH